MRTHSQTSILAKNTIINLIGMTLPLFVGLFAIPYAIKGLGTAGFGVLSISWVIISYLTLLDFGLSKAITKYISEKTKTGLHSEVPEFFWTTIVFSLVLSTVIALIFYFMIPWLTKIILAIPDNLVRDSQKALSVIPFILPFLMISVSLKGMLAAAQRFDLINFIQVPVNVLNFLIPAFSYYFHFSLPTVLLLIGITRIIACFLYAKLCFRLYPDCLKIPVINFAALKILLSFGAWVTISSFISPVLVYIDRFFIGSLKSMDALTYYSAPLEAVSRLRLIPLALVITLFPEFSIGLHGNSTHLTDLFGKAIKYIFVSSGVLSLILFFYAGELLSVWLGPDFAKQSTLILKIFSIGIFINFLTHIPFTFLQGIGKPNLPALFHIIELPVYILLLFLLTKNLGIVGSALAWCSRIIVDCILQFASSHKLAPHIFSAYKENHIYPIILLYTALLSLFIINHHIHTTLFVSSITDLVLLILFLSIIWFVFITPKEKSTLFTVLRLLPRNSNLSN